MYKDSALTTQPIPTLIRQIAIPASVGFFFNTMFNAVDTYFGGLISTHALAALSLSFPVFFIIIAMGTGISTGVTALIANSIGGGRREQAQLFAIQGITFGVLLSLLLTFLGVYISPILFSWLGASDDYLGICVRYMDTIFLGTIFFMCAYMLNSVLNGLGDTKSFRNFLIFGFVLNIILDPWFIYGGLGIPPMEVTGIAVATILTQLLGCIYLGIKVLRTELLPHRTVKNMLPNLAIFRKIARQGFPASVNMITVGIGIFVITYFISRFGKEAVAAYGIATRVEQIVLLPTIGLNTATLTIVAQNNGAGLFERVKETLTTALRYGGFIMTLGTIGVFLGATSLMGIFTDDSSVVEIGATYLKIAAFVLYAYVLLFVNVAALQGIKRPFFAVWIGVFRQIVAPIITFYVLIHFLGYGLRGIWWAIFSITWSAAVITIFYARILIKGKRVTPKENVLQ